MHGIILTNSKSFDALDDLIQTAGFDTLKIVTAWGMPDWNQTRTRGQVAAVAPNLVVRTATGDPASGNGFCPIPETVEAEVAPWYELKRRIWIEIGNEPNIAAKTDREWWEWCWYVARCAERCRKAFPKAQLIAPAFVVDRPNVERALDIIEAAHPFDFYDCIAIHAYEHFAFQGTRPAQTNQLNLAIAYVASRFPNKPLYLTEYGINDAKTTQAKRGEAYASIYLPKQVIGRTIFHFDETSTWYPFTTEAARAYRAVGKT